MTSPQRPETSEGLEQAEEDLQFLDAQLSVSDQEYKRSLVELVFLEKGGDYLQINNFHARPSKTAIELVEEKCPITGEQEEKDIIKSINQKTDKIGDHDSEATELAPMEDLALEQAVAEKLSSSTRFTRAQLKEHDRLNSTDQNQQEEMYVVPRTESEQTTPVPKRPETSQKPKNGSPRILSTVEKVLMTNHFSDSQRSAYVERTVSQLKSQGLWSAQRLPKLVNKNKTKTNWDYVLGEMQWLATDFAQERKWKMAAAKKISRAVRNYHRAKAERAKKEEREAYLKKRRTAAKIARMVHHFWDGINNVVQYKHKSLMEEKRQKILDIQLNYIVGQTERYSGYLTKQLQGESAEAKPTDVADTTTIEEVSAENQPTATAEGEQVPNEDQSKDDPMEGDEDASKASEKDGKDEKTGKSLPVRRSSRKRPASEDSVGDKPAKIAKEDEKGAAEPAEKVDPTDAEFKADNEESEDDEETLLEEEQKETEGNHEEEIKALEEENDLSIEELMKRYGYEIPTEDDATVTTSKTESEEQEMKEADDKSKTEKKEDEGSDHDEEEVGLKFLVDGETPAGDTAGGKQTADGKEAGDFDSAAKQAREIQPTGHTLATTQVKTPIPKLLRGELREYQHIGLNWLVTLYNERLNGILADEMGLGKTIQTIALLAHLACEKGVWGPHLIVVPTSVMLNWEMEFKKWCPGFKILTYYGSQKERKMKRTGWSKSNAFHVCITSYKLVVQDHAAFRRRKWRYLILDEAHNIKNFKSQRWQALLNFNSQRRLLLTGTPLQNNLMELWSLMHFLMPHLFQSRNDFKEWFANPMDGMVGGEAEYNDGIIQRLHKVLRPFLLRRIKKEVEKQMPNKYEHVVRCHLSKRQRYLYEDFMSRAATKDTLSKGDLMSVMNVLMQLRKVCNHPNLFEPRPIVTSFNTKALVYQTPSLVASATVKDSFQEICLGNVNLNLQRFCGFSTFDVDSIHTLRPARKMIEELISAPPTRPIPKKTSIPGDMRKRIMESLRKKPISAYKNRVEEVKKNAAAALLTKESSSAPSSTHHTSSSTAHKLISFTNSTALRNNISQGRPLHASTSSANPQRRMAANGQIVQLTAAGRIQIYSNARGLSGSGALDRIKGGNKRLDAESYSKWLTRIQQTRKAETLARIARVNEKRCDMSNQCLSANVISMLQGITLNKKKPVYDNRYYEEITSLFTNVLYKKMTEDETLSKIDLLVPSVEAPCMQLDVQHPVPWKEYGLKIKKEFIRNYFRQNYPSWKMNARKLLFPETQLIEYDCGKLQVLNVLLRQFISGKHRVLIFTQMTKVLDILEVFLNYHGYRYLRLDGSTHIEERMIRMERFNNDKRIFCFILSTRSGGIGVNLTGADTVVFYDSDWNPTMDAQAQDRCHRIGQTRDVHIYRLISERTVEENILRKANQKRMLNNLAIEGGHFTTQFFTKHGLKDIFDEPCSLENIDEEQKAQAKKAEAIAAAKKKSETSPQQQQSTTADVATSESTATGGNTDEKAFGEALLKSEDMEDQNAAEMVEKEQMAEMEEFGEQQNAAENEESKVVTRAEEKIRAVYEQLTSLQRFAVEFIERNSDISFDDQIHQAKEDLERAKKTWEVNHLLSLKEEEERRLEEEEDDIFYVCADGVNQHFYDVQTGEEMPTWYPPTPPMDDDDFYVDYSTMYLYEPIPMLDEDLPPYVPIIPEPKPPVRRTLKSDPNFNNCLFKHSGYKRKDKNTKLRSQLSKNKTPSSSSLLGAMRNDHVVASPKDGSDPNSLAKSDCDKNWIINEDCSVLHGLNDMVEHNPITPLPAQLLDWSLIANVVRPAGTRYRSGEDCRRRYDTTIVPREEAMKSGPNLLPGIEVNKMVADTYTPPKKKQKTSTKMFHNKNKPPLSSGSTGNIGAELTPTSASASTIKSFVEDKNRQFTRNLFGWFNTCIEIEPVDKRNKAEEHANQVPSARIGGPITHPIEFANNQNQLNMLSELNVTYEKPQNSLALNPVTGGRSKRIANQKRNMSAVNSEGGIVSASIAPGGQQQQQHPVVNITTNNIPQAVALTQQLSGFVVANGRNNVVVNSPSLARRITGQQTQYKNSSNANQSVQNQTTAKIHQNKSVPLTFRAMPGNSISQLQLQQQQPGGSSTNPPSMTVFASVAGGQQSSSLVTLSTAPTVTSSSRQQVSYQARNAGQLQKIAGGVQHVRQQQQKQQQHHVIQQVNQLKQQQVKVKQVRVSQAVHQLQGSVVQSGGKTTVVGGKAVQISKQAQPNRYDLYMKRAPPFKSFQQRAQKPIQNQKTNIKLKGETVARRSSKGGGEKGQVQAQQVRNLHQANQQQQQANTSKSTAYSLPVTAVTLNVSSASQQKMIVANNSQQLQLNSQPQMIIQQPAYFRPKQNSSQQQARQVIASKQGKAVYAAMSGGQQQLITGTREVKMGPGISTQMVQAHVQLAQPRPRRATSSSGNSKISNVSQTLTVTKLVQPNAATSGIQPRHSLVSQVRQVHPLGNQSAAQMIVSSQPITMRAAGGNQGGKTYQLQPQQPLQVNIRTPTNLNILSSSAAPQYQNISASQQLINVTSQVANTIVTSSSQISSQSNSGAGDQQQDNQSTSSSDNIQYSMHSTTR